MRDPAPPRPLRDVPTDDPGDHPTPETVEAIPARHDCEPRREPGRLAPLNYPFHQLAETYTGLACGIDRASRRATNQTTTTTAPFAAVHAV
ncbi:hypothetical protein GCM10010166_44940 [Couchioplanes caeruleus subsp. azureus]|nr:hypothetical protein GCM10010166_44940 [Couchioplanes caeruleus subsp. azureus]